MEVLHWGGVFWYVSKNAKIIFKGSANFSSGTQIICSGVINVGNDFYCNSNCIINAGDSITFGNHVLMGWNVTVLDGDGHAIISEGKVGNKYEPVIINDHVWIASEAAVLKGSIIKKNSVIAFGALVSKDYPDDGLLIGGFNKVLKRNIDWEK